MCLSTTNCENSFFVPEKKVSIVGKGQLQIPLSTCDYWIGTMFVFVKK